MARIKNSRKREDIPEKYGGQVEKIKTTNAKEEMVETSIVKGGACIRETKATHDIQSSHIDTAAGSSNDADEAPLSSMSDDDNDNQKREDEGRTEQWSARRNSLDKNVRDDYENREENVLLNQIEYIWSGVTITSSHSSATLDMKDRHYMIKSRKEDPEECTDDNTSAEESAVVSIGPFAAFSECLTPRRHMLLKQRQRTVQFLSPLVTDVQTSYRVPNHEKHKFYYTASNIRFFREEYAYESQPGCTSSFSDFFLDQYDYLCSVTVPANRRKPSGNAEPLKLPTKHV